ncbi:factor of DNA methylation 5-like [Papaver somniferum]|uniref:factor of DNA methylation 5-like n=1 Tax=Papaver somniferum TaxID=3469 RepID=UPI000E6F9F1E|nr:factor of DNA methylation 5-like [Papaver somniferum]
MQIGASDADTAQETEGPCNPVPEPVFLRFKSRERCTLASFSMSMNSLPEQKTENESGMRVKGKGIMKLSCESSSAIKMESNKRIRADDDDDDDEAEMVKLQTRVDELKKQVLDAENGTQVVEVEKLRTRVSELEKQADDRTVQVKRLEEGTKVMKSKLACYLRFCCNRDEKQRKTVDELKKSLNDKTECVESLEELNKVLTVNEHRYNNELQRARKGIGEIATDRSMIRVKRMGELDSKPFGDALKGICSSSSAELVTNQSVLLCNFWEQMLRDQAWHPFKITFVDGKHKELIDEEDKLFKVLKNEWGERAYLAVVNALLEMNEYNPSGRNPVQELWNFKENRRATVMEGVAALVNRLRKYNNPTGTMITFSK